MELKPGRVAQLLARLTEEQGLTNPLPGRPGQAPNWAGQVLFPARRPAGQVKENFQRLKFGEIYSKRA